MDAALILEGKQTDGQSVFATTRTRLQTVYLVSQLIFLTSVIASKKHVMNLDEERERGGGWMGGGMFCAVAWLCSVGVV